MFIRYFKNVVQTLTQTLIQFVQIFISKNDKKNKVSLVTDTDGNFRPSGDCLYSVSGKASVLRKQSLSRPDNPICTGYW